MKSLVPPENIRDGDRERVGGKAFSLVMMARHRMDVSDVLCIDTGDQITVDGYLGIVIISETAYPAVSSPRNT